MVWHGCSGNPMLLEHERNHGLAMDALVTECSWNMNRIVAWHGCSGNCMRWNKNDFWFRHRCFANRVLLKHVLLERNYGLDMDALVNECSWNTTELWSGHGCSGNRVLLEHKRNGNRMLLET